jgi:hypothetical protein
VCFKWKQEDEYVQKHSIYIKFSLHHFGAQDIACFLGIRRFIIALDPTLNQFIQNIRSVKTSLKACYVTQAGFPPRRPGFHPRSSYVGYVVDSVHWGRFPLPILNSPNAAYSSTIRGWYRRPNSGRRPVCVLPDPVAHDLSILAVLDELFVVHSSPNHFLLNRFLSTSFSSTCNAVSEMEACPLSSHILRRILFYLGTEVAWESVHYHNVDSDISKVEIQESNHS